MKLISIALKRKEERTQYVVMHESNLENMHAADILVECRDGRQSRHCHCFKESVWRCRRIEAEGRGMTDLRTPEERAIAVERAALAPEPPKDCPDCGGPASKPVKDEYNRWTWVCKEGCNP